MVEESIAIRQAREARAKGIKVGDGTLIWGWLDNAADTQPDLITIGKRCLIAPHVQFLCHGYSGRKPVVVGDDCYIGWGAILLPGVTIGAGSVVGAGAVVATDVPPGMVAVGNPARAVKPVDAEKHRRFVEEMQRFCSEEAKGGPG